MALADTLFYLSEPDAFCIDDMTTNKKEKNEREREREENVPHRLAYSHSDGSSASIARCAQVCVKWTKINQYRTSWNLGTGLAVIL